MADLALDLGGAVERHGAAQATWDRPQVIEAEQVVGVVVREQDGVNHRDLLAEQLQPQLRRRVDEDVALGQADQDGAAVALVARVGGLAHGTVAADHGHADRRAGAQEAKSTGLGRHVPCSRLPSCRSTRNAPAHWSKQVTSAFRTTLL